MHVPVFDRNVHYFTERENEFKKEPGPDPF